MARCPSHDWDDHVRAQDESMAAEIAWWQENQDRVLALVAAMLSNPNVNPFDWKQARVVEEAAAIVLETTNHAEPL